MNILLIDDHKIVVEGLKELLLKSSLVSSVKTITNPKLVIPFLNSNKVDAIITDINMPEISGLELIKKIQPSFPYIKIGVLSMYYNRNIISELINLNVSLCLHKNVDFEELEIALDFLNKNELYIQNNIHLTFEDTKNLPYRNIDDINLTLSPREIEVFKLIMKNHKSYEIADLLFVSINTIMAHRKNLLKKTECKSVSELIQLGMKLGLDK